VAVFFVNVGCAGSFRQPIWRGDRRRISDAAIGAWFGGNAGG
jgi:hypothetical protein